jgi:hypothetical protein
MTTSCCLPMLLEFLGFCILLPHLLKTALRFQLDFFIKEIDSRLVTIETIGMPT